MIVASLFDGLLTLFVFLGYDIHFLFLVLVPEIGFMGFYLKTQTKLTKRNAAFLLPFFNVFAKS